MDKKTRVLISTKQAVLLSLLFFLLFSCNKDEEVEEPQKSATLEMISPVGPTENVEPFEEIALSLIATASDGSSDKLVSFKFTKQFELEEIEVVIDSVLDAATFQLNNFKVWVTNKTGTEAWKFEVVDQSGDVTTKTLTFIIEGNIAILSPSITLKSGIHAGSGWMYVDGDITMELGEHFVFGFTAESESDKNLSEIKVTRNYENISLLTVLDSLVDISSYTIDIQAVAYPIAGSEVFTVTATDKNDMSTSISFTINTISEPDISVYTNISLGSYDSPTPASFSSITGETFNLSDLNDPQSRKKIDFVYFHGATWGHTVAAPGSDIAAEIYSTTIGTWTEEERNITLFGLTNLTLTQYNDVSTASQLILTIQGDGVEFDEDVQSEFNSNPAGFDVGDIIAFETDDGNRGLLKITEVNPGATNGESTIKYDLKVEKPAK